MWPGPYGEGGSRKYLLASLDESLARMGLEYVDILYSHRPTSRARDGLWFQKEFLSEDNLKRVRALNEIAQGRGQSLAQMAIAWVLRDKRITSALIGARNVEQLDNSLDALKQPHFTNADLEEIDRYAQEGSIDLWRDAREGAA